MKINYEKAYKETIEYLKEMDAYCDTCTANGCDECHRKSMGYKFDVNCLPSLHNYEEEIEINNLLEFKVSKENEVAEFKFEGTLAEMTDSAVTLIDLILKNYADQHPTEPKEIIADLVKRMLFSDIQQIIDKDYNMDDFFERTVMEMEEYDE